MNRYGLIHHICPWHSWCRVNQPKLVFGDPKWTNPILSEGFCHCQELDNWMSNWEILREKIWERMTFGHELLPTRPAAGFICWLETRICGLKKSCWDGWPNQQSQHGFPVGKPFWPRKKMVLQSRNDDPQVFTDGFVLKTSKSNSWSSFFLVKTGNLMFLSPFQRP